jgi:hypothetical protein
MITTVLEKATTIPPAQRTAVRLLANKHTSFTTFCDELKTHIGEKNFKKLVSQV